MEGQLAARSAARYFPLLSLVFATTLSAVSSSLLDEGECGIRYQYRSPPVSVTCGPNATVDRLDCWVALPPASPNTRVEIRWYRRSLSDSGGIAYEVGDGLPFQNVHSKCEEQLTPCLRLNNLTVDVSRLVITNFVSGLEGDYVCRVLVINDTSGVVIQALQPSACGRLQLDADLAGGCNVTGLPTVWQCASTEPPSTGQYPYKLSSTHSVIPELISSTQRSTFVFSRPQTTNMFLTTTLDSPSPSMSSVTAYSTEPHPLTLPTPTKSDIPSQQRVIASYIYAPLCAFLLLALIGVGITVVIIIGLRHAKEKKLPNLKVLQKDEVFADGLETSKEKGDSLKSGSTLNRNSTIYSKPVCPGAGQNTADNVSDHNYATIPGGNDRQYDTGTYSYAYQHQVCPQPSTKPPEGKGTLGGVYQELGTVDYVHMYSKPSPLLVSTGAMTNSPQDV